MFTVEISPLVIMFLSHISQALTLKQPTKEFKLHANMHHVVILVLVTFIAMLALYYSILAHATLNPISHIHVNTSKLLNITCTLVTLSGDINVYSYELRISGGKWL